MHRMKPGDPAGVLEMKRTCSLPEIALAYVYWASEQYGLGWTFKKTE